VWRECLLGWRERALNLKVTALPARRLSSCIAAHHEAVPVMCPMISVEATMLGRQWASSSALLEKSRMMSGDQYQQCVMWNFQWSDEVSCCAELSILLQVDQ
jgi:hypothetical protein